MLKQVLQFVTLLVFVAAAPLSMAQRTPLLVYTALETDQLKAFKDSIESMVKDVEIRWVRDSTGVITAKLLAEKANPQADMILGLAATSLLVLEQEGMLTPYSPKGLRSNRASSTQSRRCGSAWTCGAPPSASTLWRRRSGVCPSPSWKDLLKPIYKGQITMPHPASSGTGFLDVTAWLRSTARPRAGNTWTRCTRTSHSTCLRIQALPPGGRRRVRDGHLLRVPRECHEGIGRAGRAHLPEGRRGLGHGSRGHHESLKQDHARKVMDWVTTREANEVYAKNYAIVAMPGVAKPLPNLPPNYEQMLVKNDFGWAAKNRDRILAEWNKRYNAKAEPK